MISKCTTIYDERKEI